MKKIIYIILSVVYLTTSVGFTIATHYCGEYVNNVFFVTEHQKGEPEGCCEESEDECCSTEIKFIKLEDYHKSEIVFFNSFSQLLDIIDLDNTIISYKNFQNISKISEIYYPLKTEPYLKNLTLLI